jgi:hypothetical protein
MASLLQYIRKSPNITTWGNMFAKLTTLLLLTPFVLASYPVSEAELWLIYLTYFSFILLFDFGFSATFVRIFGYTLAGKKILKTSVNNRTGKNDTEVGGIYNFMKKIYLIISLVAILLSVLVGKYLVESTFDSSLEGGMAVNLWLVTSLLGGTALYVACYSAFLQGMNQVALVQRTQLFTSILQFFSTALILHLSGSIVFSAINYQLWMVISGLLIRRKSHKLYKNNCLIRPREINTPLKFSILQSSWRSGIGTFMSHGTILLVSFMITDMVSAEETVEYLFILQILRSTSAFSQVPFYSKLPLFSKLYAGNFQDKLLSIASTSMRQTMLLYLAICLFVWFFGAWFFGLIGSKYALSSNALLFYLMVGFGLERFGAMHMQLYSLTNHIVWHKINGITGVSIILLTSLFFNLGAHGLFFALAFLISNLAIYLPMSFNYSYKKFKLII